MHTQLIRLIAILAAVLLAGLPAAARAEAISYAAWREAGIDPAVLKKAGIGRGAGG